MASSVAAPAPGTLVQHWKGGAAPRRGGRDAGGRREPEVVYRPLADPVGRAWTRPLSGFVETVEGLDGETRPRFVPVALPGDAALRAAAGAAGVPADVVDATLARYREPQRHYHAAWHVHDVFARAEAHGIALARAQVLAPALPRRRLRRGRAGGINESLSVLLLRQAASGREGLPAPEVEAACAMVEDTAAHRPRDPASGTVIALDLATLGDAAERFDAWTELVWLEYRHLFAALPDPRAAFLARRVRVLSGLLESTRDVPLLPGCRERFAANLDRIARRRAGG